MSTAKVVQRSGVTLSDLNCVSASAGSGDAGKGVLLNALGGVDATVLAAGLPFALTDGGTIALSWANGSVQKVTIAGNRTFTFSSPVAGSKYILEVTQDATGSRTLTWPTIKWQGGSAPTLTTTASKTDLFVFIYDGTSYFGQAALNF